MKYETSLYIKFNLGSYCCDGNILKNNTVPDKGDMGTVNNQPNIPDEVVDDRGIIKKIQLYIPGFRAYRIGDDLRVADELLRRQISSNFDSAIKNLTNARSELAYEGDFNNLSMIGSAISLIQQLSGEILHSAQGYTGISPAIRIDAQKLRNLYDFDLSFLDSGDQIARSSDLESLISSGDIQGISQKIRDIKNAVEKVRSSWEKRLESVEGISLQAKGDGN